VNGGTRNPSTCSCTCPAGFFGDQCQRYVLVKWKGLSGSTGTITASWSLDHTHTGSYFNRRAAPAGHPAESVSISADDVTTTGQVGTMDFTVPLWLNIPGYPAGWHYVFMSSQGKNEFGNSLGFSQQPLQSLLYDSTRNCLSGGYRPDAGATGLCSDATWPTPSPPGACQEALAGNKGDAYKGCQTKARGGWTCQAWSAQSPQTHKYTAPQYGNAVLTSNYCRNPHGESDTIWCYTTDPNKRWEYCDPLPSRA